jgi:hypothetical protein
MKFIQATLLGFLLLPCGAAEKAKKQEQVLLQQAVAAHSIDEAIAKFQPVPLAPGKKVKRPITLKNPVLETEGRRVAYDVYSMSGRSGDSFHLTVWSYCKCFGFDKTIIVPKIIVMSGGKSLPTQIETEGKDAAGLTPLHYLTTVTGSFDSDGVVYVLVYGDTGDVGSTVTTADGGSVYVAAAATSINIGSFAITKSPVGTIAIELQSRRDD